MLDLFYTMEPFTTSRAFVNDRKSYTHKCILIRCPKGKILTLLAITTFKFETAHNYIYIPFIFACIYV